VCKQSFVIFLPRTGQYNSHIPRHISLRIRIHTTDRNFSKLTLFPFCFFCFEIIVWSRSIFVHRIKNITAPEVTLLIFICGVFVVWILKIILQWILWRSGMEQIFIDVANIVEKVIWDDKVYLLCANFLHQMNVWKSCQVHGRCTCVLLCSYPEVLSVMFVSFQL
jgi:hypothetical protein